MSMRKRLGAVLFVVCMIASCVSVITNPLKVKGAGTLIEEIAVTVEIPKVNSTQTDVKVEVPEGAGYNIKLGNGGKWTDGGGYEVSVFEDGCVYKALFLVEAEPGYQIAANAKVLVNGSEKDVTLLGGREVPASNFEFSCFPAVIGTIDQIALEDVPEAVIGETALAYSYSDPEGRYTISGSWERYNYETDSYEEMQTGVDQFENAHIYQQILTINPTEGYMLGDEWWCFINGQEYDIVVEEGLYKVYMPTDFTTQVETVTIKADTLPQATLGAAFTDETISLMVEEEAEVKAFGYWTYVDETYVAHREGTFEKGKEYAFNIEIVPKAGYSLADDIEVYIGDEFHWPDVYDVAKAWVEIRTSFKEQIDEVEFLNLPTAAVGETLKVGILPIAVPEGAAYTATGWWDYYDAEEDAWIAINDAENTHVVQNGEVYRLSVQADPAEGYDFADSVQLKAYGVLHQSSYVEPDWILFEREFSFQQKISRVEATGMILPEIGEEPSVEGLKVPEDAHYSIVSAEWLEYNGESVTTKFEAGQRYVLVVRLAAEEGYAFAEDVTALLDGEKVQSGPENGDLYIVKVVSFEEVIPQIRLENVPQMMVGETASTEIKVPEDAKYYAEAYWSVWDVRSEEFKSFSGVFEAGKVYLLDIVVFPSSGHRFDEEITEILIDGVKDPSAFVLKEEGIAQYRKEFSVGLKAIDKIELEVLPPVAGNHSSIAPVVSLPSGANYSLSNGSSWIQGSTEDFSFIKNEYFTEDGNYGACIVLLANEGYVFGDDPIVLINGKVPAIGDVMIEKTQSRFIFFFKYDSAVKIKEGLTDADISAGLAAIGLDTATKIEENMKAAMLQSNSKVTGMKLYDITLMYTEDGGITWQQADERHFPADGKIMVTLPLPEGTSSDRNKFTVLHMFSSDAYGNTAGTLEQPTVSVKTDSDGKEYLEFYVTGFSPILVGWETDTNGVPPTGDTQSMIWLYGAVAAGVALAVLIYIKKKKEA